MMPSSAEMSLNAISRRRLLLAAAGLALAARMPHAAEPRRTGDLIGEITYYLTTGEETLLDVARARNLGVPEISAVNPGIDPWVPAAERLLTLPTAFLLPEAPRTGIVINLGELRLFYFPPKDGPVQSFAIGVGREGFNTPIGETRIVRKQEQPTWYPTESTLRDKPWVGKVVPPGPDNPLGLHALYLGWPTYLIHGTNKPYGVGRRVSRGCIRMYPEGVERLFGEAKAGTKVTMVNQPVKLGWHEGELYLEVQPDLDQLDELEATYGMSFKPPPDMRQRIVDRAGSDAWRIDWPTVEAELVARRGLPVPITRPPAAAPLAEPAARTATGASGRSGPPAGAAGGIGGLY